MTFASRDSSRHPLTPWHKDAQGEGEGTDGAGFTHAISVCEYYEIEARCSLSSLEVDLAVPRLAGLQRFFEALMGSLGLSVSVSTRKTKG